MPKTKLTYHTQHGDGNGIEQQPRHSHPRGCPRLFYVNVHTLVSPERKAGANNLRFARRPRQGTSALCASQHRPRSLALPVAAAAVAVVSCRASARSYSAIRSANRLCSAYCECARRACVCQCASVCGNCCSFSSLLAHKCQGKYVLMATCCRSQQQAAVQAAQIVVDSVQNSSSIICLMSRSVAR